MRGLKTACAKAPIAAAGFAALALAVLWMPSVAAQEARRTEGGAAEPEAAWLDALLHWTIRGIELVGIASIVIGALTASAIYLFRAAREGSSEEAYHDFRSSLGRAILLGLEFLVAADIIATVAIDPTLESVAVLAGIVLVRTFLSFALEVEIEGKWPWRQGGR